MKAGELFVEIGLTGTDKVNNAIKDLDKGLKEIVDSGLAAKVAIAGVVFGIERIINFAATRGMDLKSFNILSGFSTQTVQQLALAGREIGVSAESVQGGILSLKSALSGILVGQIPAGLQYALKGVAFDSYTLATNTEYALRKLFEARNTLTKYERYQFLRPLVGDELFKILETKKWEDIQKLVPRLSTQEISELAKYKGQWAGLFEDFELFAGKEFLPIGRETLNALQTVFDGVHSIYDVVKQLTQSIPLLKEGLIGLAAALLVEFAPVTAAIAGIIYLINYFKDLKDMNVFSDIGNASQSFSDKLQEFLLNPEYFLPKMNTIEELLNPKSYLPSKPSSSSSTSNKTSSLEINQYFNGSIDKNDARDATNEAIAAANYQFGNGIFA
jgi:hypothetical protein